MCGSWIPESVARGLDESARRLVAFACRLFTVPRTAAAQAETTFVTRCTYAACALRMSGNAVLAGREGRKIASFGLFSAARLRPWIQVSDSATDYTEIIEHDYVSGEVPTRSGTEGLAETVALTGLGALMGRVIGGGVRHEGH